MCMPVKDNKADIICLQHIRDACCEVGDFICSKSLNDLAHNRMLALSLVKEIEIIGEAAGKVSDDFKKKYPQLPWEIMITTWHRLVHGYFDVDLEIIWETVTKNLPELLKGVEVVLEKEEGV